MFDLWIGYRGCFPFLASRFFLHSLGVRLGFRYVFGIMDIPGFCLKEIFSLVGGTVHLEDPIRLREKCNSIIR